MLWGRCLEEPGAPPYWPWRQLIRSYLRSSGDADPAQTLGADLADIAGIVPEVAEQFGVSPRQAEAGDNAQSRFRLFDAVSDFWRRAAQRAPLLLIFEDLHFADATSLRLFGFLANELDDSSLLVLGTYRDTELSRQHPLFETLAELARASAFQRIQLAGLSSRETEEFLAAASGGSDDGAMGQRVPRTHRRAPAVPGRDAALHDGRAQRPGDRPGRRRPAAADRDSQRRARSHRQAPEPPVDLGQPAAVDRRVHRPQLRPGAAGAAGRPTSRKTRCSTRSKRRWPCT